MNVKVYSLLDPRDNQVRYIGKSLNTKKRLRKHIKESRESTKSHKKAWINGLLKNNLKPILEIVDEVPNKEWKFWEIHYISLFRSWGFDLVNSTNGGEGVEKGNIPWNKGIKGSIPRNSTTFKKGSKIGKETRIKKGQRLSPKTEFKKGNIPFNQKNVLQFDLKGNFIKEYNSYKEAAKSIKVTYAAIGYCIKRGTNKCKGFIWV